MNISPWARTSFEQGVAALRARDGQKAMALFSQAISADANNPALPNMIAQQLAINGARSAAQSVLAAAHQRFPDHADTLANLGALLAGAQRLDEASDCFARALALNPNLATAQFNLAKSKWSLGKVYEAIDGYERYLALRPDDPAGRSAFLYSLHFDDRRGWPDVVATHLKLAERFFPGGAGALQHVNDRSPNRRLRVGYVSPFTRDHVNARLATPVLRQHDHKQFEIFAYCSAPPGRTHEEILGPHVDHWRACHAMNDVELEQTIRADAIDIAIDLCVHMEGGRPWMLAKKPAPVQINWLAYPVTSGLAAMDYRVSTAVLDPPGCDTFGEPEKLLRLPDTFWCYPADCPVAIDAPPSARNGYVTFGALNSPAKITDRCIAAFRKLLDAQPGSRLLLLIAGGESWMTQRLLAAGVDASRVSFVKYGPREQYLSHYNRVDVSLDPFPVGGHTSTHDSIWMGVPVIAMSGNNALARAGECILSHVGLSDLVAASQEEYVRLALSCARDVPRRDELRRNLRARMIASPLCDAKTFTRFLEAGYRAAWKRWCEGLPPADIDVK